MRNFFPTLNEALAAENLIELWPLGTNISYGDTSRQFVPDGKHLRMISVYRDEQGRYERPIHYMTMMPV